MFQWLINLMNKPKVLWTETDGILYTLYLIGVCVVVFIIIVAVMKIAHLITKIRKKLFERRIERMKESCKKR